MIVDCVLFIACCYTPILLHLGEHALDPFAGPVDGPVTGACPALVALPRDGGPDAVLPTRAPDRPAAGALVTHDAVGTAPRPPASCPLDGALGHALGKDRGFMPVARRQDERQELAVAFHPHMDLGTEAPLTPAEGFRIGIAGRGARCMLALYQHSCHQGQSSRAPP